MSAAPEPSFADFIELDVVPSDDRRTSPASSNEHRAPANSNSNNPLPSAPPPAPAASLADVAAEGARIAAVPTTTRAYLSAEERAEIRRREGVAFTPPARAASAAATIAAPAPVPAPPILSGATMIAGAAAAGEAVLCGWDGSGGLTRAQIGERVAIAGLPPSLLPLARTSRAQLGRAITKACGTRYEFRAERSGDAAERAYAARWTVATVNRGAEVGGAYGRCVATVTLMPAGDLVIDSADEELARTIRAEHRRLVDGEIYSAADITAWLRGVLCNVLGGVKLGGVYYVPRASAERAQAICRAMAAVWGSNWISPALPIATTDELRAGLAAGLAEEARDIIARFDVARSEAANEHARGKRKSADLSARGAATFLQELETVAERVASYAALLGAELVAPLRAEITAASEQARTLLDDTAQRALLIGEEIATERARGVRRERAGAS